MCANGCSQIVEVNRQEVEDCGTRQSIKIPNIKKRSRLAIGTFLCLLQI